MCVLAVAWAASPRWRLVAAANRDELHARPSLPLAGWGGADGIVAGRDAVGGGTWLGVSPSGRFAAVTNIRSPDGPDPARLSRGALVTEALAGRDPAGGADPDRFNPFNLIVVDGGAATLLTNRPVARRQRLAPGLHGLSNGPHGADWPKVARLEAAVACWIARDAADVTPLFAALRDEQGEGGDDPSAAPMFIRDARYGTRCSTIVTVDAAGDGTIVERRFDAAAGVTGETRLAFRWPAAVAGAATG